MCIGFFFKPVSMISNSTREGLQAFFPITVENAECVVLRHLFRWPSSETALTKVSILCTLITTTLLTISTTVSVLCMCSIQTHVKKIPLGVRLPEPVGMAAVTVRDQGDGTGSSRTASSRRAMMSPSGQWSRASPPLCLGTVIRRLQDVAVCQALGWK